jgi:transposase InsO family protein
VVVTATFQFLYVLIVLNLERRRIVHFEVTRNPTQVWLSGQMTEAFPWDTAPRYLLRDRDKSYGPAFRHRVRAMGITEIITPRRSPWQNPYVERLIGSIRRECLDHVIVLSERHLRILLQVTFRIIMMPERIFRSIRTAQALVAYSFLARRPVSKSVLIDLRSPASSPMPFNLAARGLCLRHSRAPWHRAL